MMMASYAYKVLWTDEINLECQNMDEPRLNIVLKIKSKIK